jgi:putative oxidoreductase
MRIAALIARILLGLMFFVFGFNGFLNFMPAPPISGLPGQFSGALVASHYMLFVSGVQVVAGALLLSNQYVPLAIVLLAPVLANILVFHLTMMPSTVAPGLVATLLWFVVALPLRAHFAPIFVRQASPGASRPRT